MRKEFTDAEVDDILKRFDLEEPSLQRKRVARLISDRAMAIQALVNIVGFNYDFTPCHVMAVKALKMLRVEKNGGKLP